MNENFQHLKRCKRGLFIRYIYVNIIIISYIIVVLP